MTNMVSPGVKRIPIMVTRVANLNKAFRQHCNVVFFRTSLHVCINPNWQISRDVHQMLSELFLPEYAGHTEHPD